MAEIAKWTPFLAFYWLIALDGPLTLWSPVLLTLLVPVRVWLWDYRPNGRGTRLLEADRTNPRRGFEWVATDSAVQE
jgi:hypothetical protein